MLLTSNSTVSSVEILQMLRSIEFPLRFIRLDDHKFLRYIWDILSPSHTSRLFVGRVTIFLSEPNLSGFNGHHTLADFLSPIFDESYLHAFKSSKENCSTVTDFLTIKCRGPPHTSRQDPSGRMKIKHVKFSPDKIRDPPHTNRFFVGDKKSALFR